MKKSHVNSRPQILVTPDISMVGFNGEAKEAEYRIRSNYGEVLAEAGGLPLIMPHRLDCLEDALIFTSGVLITGTPPAVQAAPERRAFEEKLIHSALARGIPVLGICHGMQLLGQCLGGKLLEVIPEKESVRINHNPRPIPDQTAHKVLIEPNNILNSSRHEVEVEVNSLHGHTLVEPGQFRILARASDGVIEAITGKSLAYCLGVQWHPEYRLGQIDCNIWTHFVEACELFAHQNSLKTTSHVAERV